MLAPAALLGRERRCRATGVELAAELRGRRHARWRNHVDEIERAERREQQFDVVDLQRHVRAMADLALPGHAARERRVPAHAEHLDVFRIFDEVAGRQSGRRTLATERHRQGIPGYGHARQQRQAAVVVQEVEAEIGIAPVLGEIAQGHAVLAVVAGILVGQARDGVAAGEALQATQGSPVSPLAKPLAQRLGAGCEVIVGVHRPAAAPCRSRASRRCRPGNRSRWS